MQHGSLNDFYMPLPQSCYKETYSPELAARKVEKTWTHSVREKEEQGDLIEAYKNITGKWERLFELEPNMATRRHKLKLFKKPKGQTLSVQEL